MPAGKAMEARAFQSPSRYVQGPGQIRKLPRFAKNYGETALAVIDTFFYKEYSENISYNSMLGCKAYNQGQLRHFVCQRVQNFTKIRNHIEVTGNFAID